MQTSSGSYPQREASRESGGGNDGGTACPQPESKEEERGKENRKLILQKTPWVLRKLVRTVKKLQKL